MNLPDEVRRIVAACPAALSARQSRNEDYRTPLHFAVLKNRPVMVAVLLALGADPLAVDGSGFPASAYAATPDADRPIMERIRALTGAELTSADRGNRRSHVRLMDLAAILALGEWNTAEGLLRQDPHLLAPSGPAHGVLHLMAKRGHVAAVRWLIDHGADPNARWGHWDSDVTALHLAVSQGHADVVLLLLAAGANPRIRDTKHDSDALGWAQYFKQPKIVEMLKEHMAKAH
jgi:hypothetical protein